MNARVFALAAAGAFLTSAALPASAVLIGLSHVRGAIIFVGGNVRSTKMEAQHSGPGGGAGKVSLNPQPLPPIVGPDIRKAGGGNVTAPALLGWKHDSCSNLIVAITMGDGSVHTAHATGDAASGRCEYDVQSGGRGHVTKIVLGSSDHSFADVVVNAASIDWGDRSNPTVNFIGKASPAKP